MEKVILFGAGSTGQRLYKTLCTKYDVVGFFDNDKEKAGKEVLGVKVYLPCLKVAKELITEKIIITSVSGETQIKRQLIELGFEERMIVNINKGLDNFTPFINQLAELFEEDGIEGSVAELGVYRGDTATKINRAFPNRKLYLFDTFEGFSIEDTKIEEKNGFSEAKEGWFEDTSVELVLEKLPYPENAVICKGFFPATVKDGLDEMFCMIRLDMDLYEPTVAALDFFHDKIVHGGVIILHDYFGSHYQGIKKATNEYLKKHSNLFKFPLSDISVAIVGY